MSDTLFPKNESTADRLLRILLGVALLAVAIAGHTAWGYLGIVPLITGIVGSCPVYSLLGITTCPYRPARKTT